MGGHDVEDQQLTSEKVQEKVVLNEPAVTEVVEPSDEVARTSPGVWKGIALTSVCTLAGLIVVSILRTGIPTKNILFMSFFLITQI